MLWVQENHASYLFVTVLNMGGIRKYTFKFFCKKNFIKRRKTRDEGVKKGSLQLGKGGRTQPSRIPRPVRGSAWLSGHLKWGWGPRWGMGAPSRMTEAFFKGPLGKKVCIKCNTDDTIGNLKKLMIAQTGTGWNNIILKKWYVILKHHVSLGDNEIHNGMNLELYYQ